MQCQWLLTTIEVGASQISVGLHKEISRLLPNWLVLMLFQGMPPSALNQAMLLALVLKFSLNHLRLKIWVLKILLTRM